MSRLAAPVASLALVALACDIVSAPPPDAELVLMVTTGHFDIVPDTVTISIDQRLRFWSGKPSSQIYPPPQPIDSDVVSAIWVAREPEVIECVRGEPTREDMIRWFFPPLCDEASVSDSLMLLTPELREIAKRINPCDPELNPENYEGSGFQWCATASARKVGETGPGLVKEPGAGCGASCMRPTACGWTWATYMKLDGWKRPWPEPFAGQDRVEVEVVC